MGSQTQQLYMYSEAKRDRATMAEVIDNFKNPNWFCRWISFSDTGNRKGGAVG